MSNCCFGIIKSDKFTDICLKAGAESTDKDNRKNKRYSQSESVAEQFGKIP